ncbi:MAG: flagellar motor switch protein FliG, partial [Planococcus sp. (in: firmicutes)]|nr:flagellar motor switch protein FliG [Planococcus sp. (in: firmicutes)]
MVERIKELTGIQKVAVLLVGMGPDVSVEVFKRLSEREIDQLTMEISNVRQLKNSQTEKVINEFYE